MCEADESHSWPIVLEHMGHLKINTRYYCWAFAHQLDFSKFHPLIPTLFHCWSFHWLKYTVLGVNDWMTFWRWFSNCTDIVYSQPQSHRGAYLMWKRCTNNTYMGKGSESTSKRKPTMLQVQFFLSNISSQFCLFSSLWSSVIIVITSPVRYPDVWLELIHEWCVVTFPCKINQLCFCTHSINNTKHFEIRPLLTSTIWKKSYDLLLVNTHKKSQSFSWPHLDAPP